MTQEILQQALIGRCHKDAADRDCPYFARDTLTKAADMLAAIAQPKQTTAYDQTALELCDGCGWKTLIPGDCCLNCEHDRKVQPANQQAAA